MSTRKENSKYRLPLPTLLFVGLLAITVCFASTAPGVAQNILNGDMEQLDAHGLPIAWSYFYETQTEREQAGFSYSAATENPFAGSHCLAIDTSEFESGSVAAWQELSAVPLRGRRIQLTAKVRGVDLPDDLDEDDELPGFGQLSITSYKISHTGFRILAQMEYGPATPIRSDSWRTFTVVVDIPKEAEIVEVGLNVVGKAKAWFDNIKIEIVDEQTALTSPAWNTQPQSFFQWWLLLAAAVMLVFVISLFGDHPIQQFAIRFTVSYWVIYFLVWWVGLLRFTELDFSGVYETISEITIWFGWNAFEERVSPMGSGSGDALYNYVMLVANLVFAVAIATCWTFVDWRKTQYLWTRDFLKSYLRYSVAIILLGYGLGKLHPDFSQFPAPSFDRMHWTYGDSSPMGLLWTFMGASQTYTFFGGLGEVVAAVLLVFRRTAFAGALVAIALMTNVVMLNYCYDVCVKLFSTHLLIASILILIPELPRLWNAFFLYQPVDGKVLSPPYVQSERSKWTHRALKIAVVTLAIVIPAFETIHLWTTATPPDFYGDYEIVELSETALNRFGLHREISSSMDNEDKAMKLRMQRVPFAMDEDQEQEFTDLITIASNRISNNSTTVSLDLPNAKAKVVDYRGRKKLLPQEFQIAVVDENTLELYSGSQNDSWKIKLQRRQGDFLLSKRGFRWVNQRPFNR